MTSVFIAEQKNDTQCSRGMGKVLQAHFPTIRVCGGRLRTPGESARFLLSDFSSFGSVESGDALLIVRDTPDHSLTLTSDARIVAVVDACNPRVINAVSDLKLPAITCGLSPRDTVTLSSIHEDSAVINLQRTVTCFDGSEVEPQEFPIQLSHPMDSFTLMAIASVLILSGNVDKLESLRL